MRMRISESAFERAARNACVFLYEPRTALIIRIADIGRGLLKDKVRNVMTHVLKIIFIY